MKCNPFVLVVLFLAMTFIGSVPKARAMALCTIPGFKGNSDFSNPNWAECSFGTGMGEIASSESATSVAPLLIMDARLDLNSAEARQELQAQIDAILKGMPVNPSENLVGALAQQHQVSEEEMAGALQGLLDSQKAIDDSSINDALARLSSAK